MKTIKSLTEAEISELPKPPEGWIWVKLDTIGELFCGQSPSIKEVNQERCGIPYVTGPEQWDGSKIEETKWTEFPKRLVPEGCIFITVKGAGVGKIFPGISCAIGRDIYAFLPSSKVDFKYTLHAIKHQINLVIMKAQGDIPGLSKNHILDHVIGLCSIKEQRAIVSKIEQLFSELDNGISNLKLAQEQLKVYRQAVLKKAFEGELTKKWREQQTDLPDAGDLLEQIRKEREEAAKATGKKLKPVKYLTEMELEELPKLPKLWRWVKIDSLVENHKNSIKAGPFGSSLKKEYYVPSGFKIYGQEQVISGDCTFGDYYISEEKYKELESCKVKPFDVLISLVGTIGKVLILPENCEAGVINPRLIKLSLNRNYYWPVFFKYYFESMFLKSLYKVRAHGATMDILTLGIISELPFPLCSLLEQQAIVQEIETRLSVCNKIEQDIETNLEKAEALRQSILKKAFEGKLLNEKELAEVRGTENWEPAEVLLERIKAEKAKNGKK
ncbi:restriction endonuclease subunit S [Methanosarcina barkeri]|uniref:Type I restriction-modification system S subunit HsdS5 n=1 Tax=Methanosarcina barkeri CM1 TaxID=796385 RepID=A0A0G3CBD9_METBA|nr:restriction endonuclease subunit S [Methanosarcina barkeri]AKJ39314.1 type I restriction-modification system S subunit HsdS5 [Methanosarcina barkeri CM1]